MRVVVSVVAGFAALAAGWAGAATIAPYGTWRSPISARTVAESTAQLSDLRVVDGMLYWSESLPAERGRTVISSESGGQQRSLTPAGFDVRTRVHEYGGAAYTAAANAVYFSNFADQRLHEQRGEASPRALTPEGIAMRTALSHPQTH